MILNFIFYIGLYDFKFLNLISVKLNNMYNYMIVYMFKSWRKVEVFILLKKKKFNCFFW